MSEPGQGRGKKGKGRKGRGRGRGGQQQQQHGQRKNVPGGLQQREEQGATAAVPEQQLPTETKRPPQQKLPQQKQPPQDRTDGAGLSKPQGQSKVGAGPSGPPRQSVGAQQTQPSPQPSTKGPKPAPTPQTQPQTSRPHQQPQSQPSPGAAKPAPSQQAQSQPSPGAEKRDQARRPRESSPHSDRAVPKPPRRPDGGGKSGRPITLRANFLHVKLPGNDIHHYHTEIRAKGMKPEEGYTKSEAPKIIQEVVKIYETENPSGPKLAFDRNGKNMYCRTLIPGINQSRTFPLKFTTDNGKEKDYTIEVRWVGKVSLYNLNEALEGRLTEIPYDTLQAIEVVLQQMPKMRTIQVRSSFFDYPTGREKDLGGGLQVWNGTFVSIRPTQWKMMLNIDTCSTAFYKAQPVLDLMREFLNVRNLPRRLDENQRRKFAKEIKALKVETTHMKRKQKASGLSVKSAKDETFDCEGRKVSVLNYFRETYQITLQYPDLPCVKIGGKGSLIPMELCRVVESQKKQGKLTGAQTQEMIRHTAIPAPDRMQKIQELIHKLRYQEDPYLRDFQISIGREMATIQGRVLDPPVLNYGPSNRPAKETPRDGAWRTQKQMLDPKELREWALISYVNDDQRMVKAKWPRRYRGPDHLDDGGIDHFIEHLVGVGREKGLRINQNPCYVGTERGFHGTEKLFGNLKARYPNLQLIVVVLPIAGDDFYEEVKHCGDVVHGINMQCIKVEKASDDFSDWRKRETLVNLSFKINAKLGGTTCAIDKGVKSPILSRPVIIFGADVTHPGAGDKSTPSIAAVVASKDSGPTLYNAEVRVQKHRQEMIEDLKDMVKILLKKFRSSTGAIPQKIIFYRDGVSEGQFRDVLLYELYAIQRACLELQNSYKPEITFIVVQKRHHARFFATDPKERKGKSQNIPAGTVVDQQICHPFEFNWYLCSHAGIQGTSKPALYHVLYDDSNFSSDLLQILTNQLCYTYVRCARSVSIPAPAYYAHHVAFRARHHLKTESSTEGSVASDDSGPSEVTQEMKNLVAVHPNVNCTMYFA